VTTTTSVDSGAFTHPALFYHSRQEYLDCLAPFITDGLRAGQPVLVAVPGPNLALLRDAVGDSAADVTMIDMTTAGRNPGWILGGILSHFVEKHAPHRVRMIGEQIWPSRSKAEYPACVQHEALVNTAFAGQEMTVLCPYDATQLDAKTLADARTTHPLLWHTGQPEADSPAFAPEAAWQQYNEPLPSSPTAATYTVSVLADLAGARAFAATYAQWFGLSPNRVADLLLIANELAASCLHHADGACQLEFWRHDGHLVCQARDGGYLDDPLTGRRPYGSDSACGRGLGVVNAVADLLRSHTMPGATTIRAYLRVEDVA
jgi:hypothetical protein